MATHKKQNMLFYIFRHVIKPNIVVVWVRISFDVLENGFEHNNTSFFMSS